MNHSKIPQTDSIQEPALMYKPNIDTKYQIACEIFKNYDDIDERYHRSTSNIPLHIACLVDCNKTFASEDELREEIKRSLEIYHNPIVGSQYFSRFSLECIQTYRAGSFRACVMLTQSVCEGLIRFVAERNEIAMKKREKALDVLKKLRSHKLITTEADQACKAILRESYRNELHHMNPEISKIEDWHQHAKQHLRNLATIEYWIFGYDMKKGVLYPHYPQHWDSNDNGHTIRASLRCAIS